MAETLGMLCDQLTIIKLKQFHTEDGEKLDILSRQAGQLQKEIDDYVKAAFSGNIPEGKLTFASNKVFKKEGNFVPDVAGSIGEVFYQLAEVNCQLWHQQEKVYDFEKVPAGEKDSIVKQLAVLNLKRNKCIDAIDKQLATLVINKQKDL